MAITTASSALAPCCNVTANGFAVVPNLSEQYEWIDGLRGRARVHIGRPGFSFSSQGRTVVSSWRHIADHVRKHGPRAWEDLLHAVAKPCLVLPERPGKFTHPRYALYRLRPGLDATFRMAVLEDHGDGSFLVVTALPKKSFANDHFQALFDRTRIDRCPAFCLRYRDIDPDDRREARPDRVAPCATVVDEDGCCERQLECLNFQPARADGLA